MCPCRPGRPLRVCVPLAAGSAAVSVQRASFRRSPSAACGVADSVALCACAACGWLVRTRCERVVACAARNAHHGHRLVAVCRVGLRGGICPAAASRCALALWASCPDEWAVQPQRRRPRQRPRGPAACVARWPDFRGRSTRLLRQPRISAARGCATATTASGAHADALPVSACAVVPRRRSRPKFLQISFFVPLPLYSPFPARDFSVCCVRMQNTHLSLCMCARERGNYRSKLQKTTDSVALI